VVNTASIKDNTDTGKIEAYAVYNSDDIGRVFQNRRSRCNL
jgi:hypothetical protein